MSSIESEEKRYQEEVAAVKNWWSDSRWRYTKRPFTAEQIVQKRGNLKMTYANNEISKKLWNILENRFKVGESRLSLRYTKAYETLQNEEASFTYGCLDPVMVTQMAKYIDTVYVSGWQSSSTASASDEPGPDLADYPYVRTHAQSPFPKLTRLDHRPKQSWPSLDGTALSRP